MAATSSLLLTGCAKRPAEEPSTSGGRGDRSLAGTTWTMQALGNDVPAGMPGVTLAFGLGGEVSGNDGCNSFQGDYTAAGTTLAIGRDLATTLRACPDPVEARARAFHEALQRAAGFDLDDTGLRLYDGAGTQLLSLTPAIDSPMGASWEVTAIHNAAQAVVSVIVGTRISARFGSDGRLTGNAGCNEYFADYEQQGELIRIGAIGATRRFCADPEGSMQQEALYLEALRRTATFALAGNRLELRAADGTLLVTLAFSAKE